MTHNPSIRETLDSVGTRSHGLISSFVPDSLLLKALSTRLETPNQMVVGRRNPFLFHMKNRLPITLSLTLPTSQVWGWEVDGKPMAGLGRYDPPEVPTDFVFAPRESRTFTGYWDGQFYDRSGPMERWSPADGDHQLTAYLAVTRWAQQGKYDRAIVEVVE